LEIILDLHLIHLQQYTGTLNYYAKFAALSDTNTTNYILASHPAIYLYGSLYHAANFLGGIDPQRLQQWQQYVYYSYGKT
jgi:hypothetical protein